MSQPTKDNKTDKEDNNEETAILNQNTTIGTTKWLRLETIQYRNFITRQICSWDRVVRTTKQSETSTDAVVIIANIHKQNIDYLILVKQYRPPIRSMAIEFPAGLIDAKETAEDAARRELYEETGYVVKELRSVSPSVVMSPGLTNESVCLVEVVVDVDESKERGGDGDMEEIERGLNLQTVLLPKKDLRKILDEMCDKDGLRVFGMLYSYAMSL